MKRLPKKVRNYFYHKNTFMLIPHTEKKIISLHLSNLSLSVIVILGLFIMVTGTVLSFKLPEKMMDYDYYLQQNAYYKGQIEEIHNVMPNITKSQNTLFDKFERLFTNLGIESLTDKPQEAGSGVLNTVAQLENVDDNMENVGSYIKNTKLLFSQIPSIFPLVNKSYWFSSNFGYRIHPILRTKVLHTGQDIATIPGAPVMATADGLVRTAGWSGPYGISVYLIHERGFSSRYAHLMRTNVGAGSMVKKGQIIGYVGSTGMSTGYHLHYEVIFNNDFLNPMDYMYLDKFGGL